MKKHTVTNTSSLESAAQHVKSALFGLALVIAAGSALAAAPRVTGEAVKPSMVAPKSLTETQWRGTIAQKVRATTFKAMDPARITAAREANRKQAESTGNRKRGAQIGIVQTARQDAFSESSSALSYETLATGAKVAYFEVKAVDAPGVRIGLAIADLPDDAELRFAGSANLADVVHTAYGRDLGRQLDDAGLYWTPVTEGDMQRVELYLPPSSVMHPKVTVAQLSYLFAVPSDSFKGAYTPKVDASGSCNVDVICRPQTASFLNARNAVANMVYQAGSGSFTCSGTLLNDSDSSTQIPYFYSANHCISTQTSASTLITYWDFQKATCAGAPITRSVATAVFGGAQLLYASGPSDVSFLRLNNPPPANGFFLGWDAAAIATDAPIAVIHHPNGDPKKSSIGQALGFTTQPFNGFTGNWIVAGYTSGTTETGSSGSGLLTNDNTGAYFLRGGLAGGGASCLNSGSISDPNNRDIYSRFDEAFPTIKQWLFPTAATGPAFNYTDLWWNPAENGWGMSVVQHSPSNQQFNALYIYDAQGNPVWVVMPGGTWSNNFTTFTGAVYIPTGSFWQNYTTANFRANAIVGTVTINYTGANNATVAYTINGLSGSKNIERQNISGGTAPLNAADMWYGGASQDGWGVSILQQTGTPFAIWYTYGNTCTGTNIGCAPTWFVMPGGGSWAGNVYTAPLYSTRGSPWLGTTYTPASLVVNAVGTLSFNFTSATAATMTYTVGAVSQSKAIVRQTY